MNLKVQRLVPTVLAFAGAVLASTAPANANTVGTSRCTFKFIGGPRRNTA